MANVYLMDLGFLFFIGLTAAFANDSAAVGKEANQGNGLEVLHLDVRSDRPAVVLNSPSGPAACPTCDVSKPRRRSKRCTCYTYKDKECVYYCHLDIIWINTPERTVPYGMSSYRSSQRMRRSPMFTPTGQGGAESPRCTCAVHSDVGCRHFCTISTWSSP